MEGGGGLVRAALIMSALTQLPVRIDQVRSGTKFPGLDLEDLQIARALARSCQAETVGAELGSPAISFLPTQRPRALKADLTGIVEVDADRRQGNALVVLSSLIPVLARTGGYSELTLTGETFGNHALSYDYFVGVTVPALSRLGLYTNVDLEVAGFGRESQGRIRAEIEPSAIQGAELDQRGKLLEARGRVSFSQLPTTIAQRGVSHLNSLSMAAKIAFEAEAVEVESASPGIFLTTWLQFEHGFAGFTTMGSRSVRVESLAQNVVNGMLDFISSGDTIDPFLADQIVLTAVFADGPTVFKVPTLTKRFLTIVWVIKQFVPIHITVRGRENGPGEVRISRL